MFSGFEWNAHILKILGLSFGLWISSPFAQSQEGASPSSSHLIQLRNRLRDFNNAFTEHLKQQGFEVQSGPNLTSPVHIRLPSGIKGKLVMTATKGVLTLDLHAVHSTCGPISRPIHCTTDLVFHYISGLKVVDGNSHVLKVLKQPTENFDITDFLFISANYMATVESRIYDERFKSNPQFVCENFDFLPPGEHVTVLNWAVDQTDSVNFQTGQNEAFSLRQTPGFKGRKLSENTLDLDLFPINARTLFQGDYLPNANSRFQWSVWDEDNHAACKVDFSIKDMPGFLDIFTTSKKESKEMDLQNGNIVDSRRNLDSAIENLNYCENSGTNSLRDTPMMSELLQAFSPTIQFMDRFNLFERILPIQFFSENLSNGTDTAKFREFKWDHATNPNCSMKAQFKWPE